MYCTHHLGAIREDKERKENTLEHAATVWHNLLPSMMALLRYLLCSSIEDTFEVRIKEECDRFVDVISRRINWLGEHESEDIYD